MIMQRTTIMLPMDLRAKAFQRARELHISLGEFIRHSLRLSITKTAQKETKDSLFLDGVIFKGNAPSDLARNHDRYLYEEEKS